MESRVGPEHLSLWPQKNKNKQKKPQQTNKTQQPRTTRTTKTLPKMVARRYIHNCKTGKELRCPSIGKWVNNCGPLKRILFSAKKKL